MCRQARYAKKSQNNFLFFLCSTFSRNNITHTWHVPSKHNVMKCKTTRSHCASSMANFAPHSNVRLSSNKQQRFERANWLACYSDEWLSFTYLFTCMTTLYGVLYDDATNHRWSHTKRKQPFEFPWCNQGKLRKVFDTFRTILHERCS